MTPYDSIKYHRQMLQAGFMAMDPISGEIKAWVGGIDFKTFKFDHVNVNTKRQVGSTIKPLLYSLAIEEAGFTPTTMVQDVQQDFGSLGLVPNTSATCTGRTVPMANALAWSRNCASAYILKQLGNNGNDAANRFAEFLKKCNFTTKIDPYPSIALGAAELSLYEMMQGYSMFPGHGFNAKPLMIARIEDKNGNVLENFLPAQRKEVINEVTAYSIALMMEGVVKNGTGQSLGDRFGLSSEIAGKTGTTNDNSDAWFMGYTPQLLAGTWVGCDDRFIRFNGDVGECSSAALPIWAYFFNKALADKTLGLDRKAKFSKPEVMSNDVIFDYMNTINAHSSVPAQGEDVGNGTSEDYLIPDAAPEEIGAESDIPVEKAKPGTPTNTTPANETPAPAEVKPEKQEEKKGGFLRGIFGRKKKKDESQEPPKAVMPGKDEKQQR
jgi:penicillin-binding protein 1A